MLMGCKAVQQADRDMDVDAETEDAMVERGLCNLQFGVHVFANSNNYQSLSARLGYHSLSHRSLICHDRMTRKHVENLMCA